MKALAHAFIAMPGFYFPYGLSIVRRRMNSSPVDPLVNFKELCFKE